MIKIEDKQGRRFEKLRLSLLNSCNFACEYCTTESHEQNAELKASELFINEDTLKISTFIQLITAIHNLVNLKSVRLTGGEPLLYPHLIPLIKEIKELGITDIRLTSNAYYLKNKAKQLKDAGLESINISVDALDPTIFKQISRHPHPSQVFDGIKAAISSGLKVKLNTVVMRNRNESQILPLLDYAGKLGVKIRYLELMKMGHLYHKQNQAFFSEKEILNTIRNSYSISELPREKSATSRYWSAGKNRTFGIIANESTPFCHDCNRLRLDSRGYFYGCLSNSKGEKLFPYINNQTELAAKLKKLLLLKQPIKFKGSNISMKNIGG